MKKYTSYLNHFRLYTILITLFVFASLIGIVSLFLGNPFTHKVDIAFISIQQPGWFISHYYIVIILFIISLLFEFYLMYYIRFILFNNLFIKPYLNTNDFDTLKDNITELRHLYKNKDRYCPLLPFYETYIKLYERKFDTLYFDNVNPNLRKFLKLDYTFIIRDKDNFNKLFLSMKKTRLIDKIRYTFLNKDYQKTLELLEKMNIKNKYDDYLKTYINYCIYKEIDEKEKMMSSKEKLLKIHHTIPLYFSEGE